jgi:putative transcriptional regulator
METNDRGLRQVIKWRLAAVMADREIDYKELASMTGLAATTVSTHKNRKQMPARLDSRTLNAYCIALDCQPGELMRYVKDKEVDPNSKVSA